MQATKPMPSSSSAVAKKCQRDSQRSNGSNRQLTNADTSNQSKDKSIAQRVMDMATTPTAPTTTTSATGTTNTNTNQVTQTSNSKQPSSNNSAENDHEVEAITNRASKIDISPVNSNTSSSNNINTNGNSNEHSNRFSSSSSPSLLLLNTVTNNNNIISPAILNTASSSSSSNQQFETGASNEPLAQTNAGRCANSLDRISLETKVPHPLNLVADGSGGGSRFQPSSIRDDEVSYYNDSMQHSQHANNLLEPKQVGGSLDNNTKPKLLLAASIREHIMGSSHMLSANTINQARQQQQQQPQHQNQNRHQQQQQQPSFQQLRQQQHGQFWNSQQHGRLDGQPTYEHKYMSADEYDDIYDLHYDNAIVVEKEAAAAAGFNQLTRDNSSNCLRYHEISTLTHPGHETAPPQQQQLQHLMKPSSSCRTVSISTSPKAKSAPATPCNVTPTAFHQTSSLKSSLLNPNLANTLPPDLRKNMRIEKNTSATCRVLPSSIGLSGAAATTNQGHQSGTASQQQPTSTTISSKYLDNLIESGEVALMKKDYNAAVRLFSQCVKLATTDNQNVVYLRKNFKIYGQRAEAHFQLGNYNQAIEDSMAARELNPKWAQAYYLQGRSQIMNGQYADSLAIFSFGLTQDPNNELMFEALIEAALNSAPTFKQEFEPKFNKLKSLQLDSRPFVVVSVLGQELLASGHSEHAAIVLESALKLSSLLPSPISSNHGGGGEMQLSCLPGAGGNNSQKFRSSVLSTISLAYCMLHDYDKAISYMHKELDIETELEDVSGQCRVLSNLGYTYYKVRKFDKSLEAHRKQLNLAMKTNLYPQASQALNAIGHVHVAKCDYSNALTSHTRCLEILKLLGDDYYSQFKELLAIGHIHSMLNDPEAAEEKYTEANQLLKQNHANKMISQEELTVGTIMVNFNMAYLALKRQSFMKAKQCYSSILELTQSSASGGPTTTTIRRYEMRAFNGLGQTCRLYKKFDEARSWFEKQLQLAKTLNDQLGQSQALCNLGMIYQHHADHQDAWRLFDENLKLVEDNPLLKAYAHSYMGSAYSLMGHSKESREHYETSLNLFKELGYCSSEQKTIDENIASIERRVGNQDLINQAINNLPPAAAATHQKKVMMAS